MNLRKKVVLLYLCITAMVIVFIGIVVPVSLEEKSIQTTSENTLNTLKHIDFALSNFIEHPRYDLAGLSLVHVIQNGDSSEFTSYLNSSYETFGQSTGENEDEIVGTLMDFQLTHPYVESVYIGYENGAYVRSQEWENSTRYDPRTRPWYILAKENPEETVITQPYVPITSSDVKIGISKAIIDGDGNVSGVIGTDITLISLTNYISDIETNIDEGVILTDRNGIVLASGNSSLIFTDIQDRLYEQTSTFLNTDEGIILVDDYYLIYYTSPELGWKIGEFIPVQILNQQIYESFIQILIFVVFALVLLSIITLFIINHTVIRPISVLTKVSRKIAETGDLDQDINTDIGEDEIATLARSLKGMVNTIRNEELERKEMEKQVAASIQQIEDNLGKMAMLNDEIRNPLTVVLAYAENIEDDKIRNTIIEQVSEIDSKVKALDRGWLQSEKVWKFLHKYYGIEHKERIKKKGKKDEKIDEDSG
jgi:methyl-accepting chemotaxis protein